MGGVCVCVMSESEWCVMCVVLCCVVCVRVCVFLETRDQRPDRSKPAREASRTRQGEARREQTGKAQLREGTGKAGTGNETDLG